MKRFIPDPNSEQWQGVLAWAEAEIGLCYKKLAGLSTPEEQTQQLRGSISTLNKLVGLTGTVVVLKHEQEMNG